MPKQRRIGKIRRQAARPVQKVMDEYTGATVYSDNLEKDYKGLLTTRGHADPKPIPEYKVNIPVNAIPYIIRKETEQELVPIAEAWEAVWDTYSEEWNESELEY